MSNNPTTQHGVSNLGENQCPIRQLSNFDGLPLRDWKEDVRSNLKSRGLIDFLDRSHKPIPKELYNMKNKGDMRKYLDQYQKWEKDRGIAFSAITGSLKEGTIAKTITMKLQKEDRKGEKLFPILDLLEATFGGCKKAGLVQYVERLCENEGPPTKKVDLIQTIEDQYEMLGEAEGFGENKEHAFSEQMKIIIALVRAKKITEFKAIMTEFIKIQILLNEDQGKLKDITYPKVMEKLRALIRAEKAGEEYKTTNFNAEAAVNPEKKFMCAHHKENASHNTENCYFLNRKKKEDTGGRGRGGVGRGGSRGRGRSGNFSGGRNQGGRYQGRGTGRGHSFDRNAKFAHERTVHNHATEVEEEYVDDLGDSWVQEHEDDDRYTDEGGVKWVRKRELEDFESHNKILKLDESESEIECAYFGMHVVVIDEDSSDEEKEQEEKEQEEKGQEETRMDWFQEAVVTEPVAEPRLTDHPAYQRKSCSDARELRLRRWSRHREHDMAQKKSRATEDSWRLAVEETRRRDFEENLMIEEAIRQSLEEAKAMEEKEESTVDAEDSDDETMPPLEYADYDSDGDSIPPLIEMEPDSESEDGDEEHESRFGQMSYVDELEYYAELRRQLGRQQRGVNVESLHRYVNDYMELHFGPRRIAIEEFNNMLESDDEQRAREQRVEDELQGLAEFHYDRIVIIDIEGRIRNDESDIHNHPYNTRFQYYTLPELISDDTWRYDYSVLQVTARAIVHVSSDEDIIDNNMFEVEDVGDLYTTQFAEANAKSNLVSDRGDILADTGASHHIVNDQQKLENERPAKGSIRGSDPNSQPDQITSKGYLWFMGRRVKAFRANNIPKSVIAIVNLTEELPLSFEWRKGACQIRDWETGQQLVIASTKRLTKLPSSLFSNTY